MKNKKHLRAGQLWPLFLMMAFTTCLADDVTLYVARNMADSRIFLEKGGQNDKLLVSDLQKQDKGEICSAKSVTPLSPGRYRLHLPLAMAPLGDAAVGDIAVTIRAGDRQRIVHPVQFPASDVFEDFTIDFIVSENLKPTVTAEWAVPGKQAQMKRQTIKTPPAIESDNSLDSLTGDSGGEASAASGVFLAGDGAPITLADARQIPCRLMARLPHLEPLAPIAIEEVRTDRITYKPGQKGMVAADIRNYGRETVSARLSIELLDGLSQTTRLHGVTLQLNANEATTWQGAFDTSILYWGAEIRATVACEGFEPADRRAVFGVASNFWELAIMTSHQGLGLVNAPAMSPEQAQSAVKTATAQGFTGFEAFFWAPCDMIDFTPDEDVFFACQGGTRFTVNGTRNLIAAAHQAGMAAVVYANLWGAAGPVGIELMRKHPDWFGQAEFAAYYVDDWSLMQKGRMSAPGIWLHNQINVETCAPLFQRHSEEIIASHRQFGWDGTRYDSYYSAEWTKAATARVRATVEKEIPDYQWGYNSFAGADERAQALDIMVGGGGLIMEEGLGRITETGGTLGQYAGAIARFRDIIWPHNGHFGLVYRGGTPTDAALLSSVLLAGGSHPYYGRLESEVGEHQLFALRYAELLWNNRMRPLKDPQAIITIPDAERFLLWSKLARTVTLAGRKQRLIIHLINARPEYQISGKTPATAAARIAGQVRKLPVSIKLSSGARVENVWVLRAAPRAEHASIPHLRQGDSVTFEVPEVRFWSVIVVDYEADKGMAADETVSPATQEVKP